MFQERVKGEGRGKTARLAAKLETRILAALKALDTGNSVYKIAVRFGVDPSTVQRISRPLQRISRPFEGATAPKTQPAKPKREGGVQAGLGNAINLMKRPKIAQRLTDAEREFAGKVSNRLAERPVARRAAARLVVCWVSYHPQAGPMPMPTGLMPMPTLNPGA
jgi:hypothetical protein